MWSKYFKKVLKVPVFKSKLLFYVFEVDEGSYIASQWECVSHFLLCLYSPRDLDKAQKIYV